MPTFEEAKTILKKFYIENGFRLIDEGSVELLFAFGLSDAVRLSIPEDEIREYQETVDKLTIVRVAPVETSIIGVNYREQLIYSPASRVPILALRRTVKFENAEGDGTTIVIGPPSSAFFNFFRLSKDLARFLHARLDRVTFGVPATMRNVFGRFATIRITKPDTPNDLHTDEATSLLESCLFEYSYLRSIPVQLQNEWPSLADRHQRPVGRRFRVGDTLPIKRIVYDIPAVRLYQRGLGTDDAYIQFISFYHVLEYYFVNVSDSILYRKLSRLFVDPAFRPTARHLDKLILAVEDHKRTNDETEMLKNVLTEYVDEKEVADFIQNHEAREIAKIYTEKSECFGDELEKMTIREGHILGPIAKRIKTIRNKLIHSSDRYERKERYLPGPEADRVLLREIPLLRFIAERVIIATARSLG
jgi:hypothetical protein